MDVVRPRFECDVSKIKPVSVALISSVIWGRKDNGKFTLQQTTKAQGVVEVSLYPFFNLGTRWGGWSTPRLGRFTPGKGPETRCIGGCVGLRVGLDGCWKIFFEDMGNWITEGCIWWSVFAVPCLEGFGESELIRSLVSGVDSHCGSTGSWEFLIW
jgi:hypothetical protein